MIIQIGLRTELLDRRVKQASPRTQNTGTTPSIFLSQRSQWTPPNCSLTNSSCWGQRFLFVQGSFSPFISLLTFFLHFHFLGFCTQHFLIHSWPSCMRVILFYLVLLSRQLSSLISINHLLLAAKTSCQNIPPPPTFSCSFRFPTSVNPRTNCSTESYKNGFVAWIVDQSSMKVSLPHKNSNTFLFHITQQPQHNRRTRMEYTSQEPYPDSELWTSG